MFAARMATREDIDIALGNPWLPDKPPDLTQCYASDLQVRQSNKEAMPSEYAHLWEDSRLGECHGLLDAGT